jgi:hypothetical protein
MALLVNLVDCVYQAVMPGLAVVVLACPVAHGQHNVFAGTVTPGSPNAQARIRARAIAMPPLAACPFLLNPDFDKTGFGNSATVDLLD